MFCHYFAMARQRPQTGGVGFERGEGLDYKTLSRCIVGTAGSDDFLKSVSGKCLNFNLGNFLHSAEAFNEHKGRKFWYFLV